MSGRLAELKGRLALVGKSLPTTDMRYRRIPAGVKPTGIVTVRKVEGSPDPDFPCSYTDCVACDELCFVSNESAEQIAKGIYQPMCPGCTMGWMEEMKTHMAR
jgi:hypothetical protein